MSERTAVYRTYDASGSLLYIGIARSFGTRWTAHARVQSWWGEVQRQTVDWYPAREDAELEERRAIHAEMPVHNVANSPWEKRVRDDGTGFYVIPKPVPGPRVRVGPYGNPRRTFRFEPGLWEAFISAASRDPHGRVPAVIVRDFIAWYASQCGSRKPERPPSAPKS